MSVAGFAAVDSAFFKVDSPMPSNMTNFLFNMALESKLLNQISVLAGFPKIFFGCFRLWIVDVGMGSQWPIKTNQPQLQAVLWDSVGACGWCAKSVQATHITRVDFSNRAVYLSNVCLTLAARSGLENGFWIKFTPFFNIPRWAMTSAV